MKALGSYKEHIRYLQGTEDMQLTFESDNPTEVEGFTDSDYARNRDSQKWTLGYVSTYGGGTISWRSKLQDCITLLTIEAEYIATSEVAEEAIWLHRPSTDFSTRGRTD